MESTSSTLDPPAKDIRHMSSESDEISCLTSDNSHLGGNTATSAGGRKKWGREGSYTHSGGGETSRPNPEGGVGGAAKAAKKRGRSSVPIWKKLEPIQIKPFVQPS